MIQLNSVWLKTCLTVLIVSFCFVAPVLSHAKGVLVAPLIMSGSLEDMKTTGDKILFLFSGQILKSQWAKGEWELNALVNKVLVQVDQTFFFKHDEPMWGYRFEEQKDRALECIQKVKNLSITVPNPTLYFGDKTIEKVEGDIAQIEGCGE